ncbi:hypothetical protein L218DRAFT_1007991 [Marasmius fiardii PR-910]|nr:hypothetical protein L218DRAFT_1007991 [Marasmius fiardii PR-910]
MATTTVRTAAARVQNPPSSSTMMGNNPKAKSIGISTTEGAAHANAPPVNSPSNMLGSLVHTSPMNRPPSESRSSDTVRNRSPSGTPSPETAYSVLRLMTLVTTIIESPTREFTLHGDHLELHLVILKVPESRQKIRELKCCHLQNSHWITKANHTVCHQGDSDYRRRLTIKSLPMNSKGNMFYIASQNMTC